MAEQKVFVVNDMTCNHCRQSINQALSDIGLTDFNVDVDSKRVHVTYEAGKHDPEAIREAIEEAGFTVA